MPIPPITTLGNLLTPPTADQILAQILQALSDLGLPVTSWADDDPFLQLLTEVSNAMAAEGLVVSDIAAGGFLDTAAQLSDPTWLRLIAWYVYGVAYIAATSATGQFTLTNSTGSPIIVAAGDVRAANATGYTYTSTTGGTVNAHSTLDVTIVADQPGTLSNAGAATIAMASPIAGLTGSNSAAINGTADESNTALVTRCKGKLASRSPNGAAGASQYFGPLAPDGTGSLGVTRITVAPSTGDGSVLVYAANASGPISGTIAPPDANPAHNTVALRTWLLSQCVPDYTSLIVAPADIVSIVVTATIYTSATVIASDFVTALENYLASVPIGGVMIGAGNVIPKSAIIGVLSNPGAWNPALKGVVIVAVELSAPSADVSMIVGGNASGVGTVDGSSAITITAPG